MVELVPKKARRVEAVQVIRGYGDVLTLSERPDWVTTGIWGKDIELAEEGNHFKVLTQYDYTFAFETDWLVFEDEAIYTLTNKDLNEFFDKKEAN